MELVRKLYHPTNGFVDLVEPHLTPYTVVDRFPEIQETKQHRLYIFDYVAFASIHDTGIDNPLCE